MEDEVVEIKGKVLDDDNRSFRRQGGTYTTSIPIRWVEKYLKRLGWDEEVVRATAINVEGRTLPVIILEFFPARSERPNRRDDKK